MTGAPVTSNTDTLTFLSTVIGVQFAEQVMHLLAHMNFLKNFFRQSFLHTGGMFLEVEILKIFDPIWGFHPKFFFKSHQFLVISHIDGVSWSDCLPRGVYI